MSYVSNIMVSVSYDDISNVVALSEWLETEPALEGARRTGYLRETTGDNSIWGGFKRPECNVWAGALNGADLDALLSRVATTPWQVPHAVQVLIKDQPDEFFRLWMLRDGELRQYAPTTPLETDQDFYPPHIE